MIAQATSGRIHASRGVGVALGAQAGHEVTNHGSPEGYLICTVFAKKCQKRSKRGAPPILTTFGEDFTVLGTPPPLSPELSGLRKCPPFPILGDIFRTSSRNFEVGGNG